MTSQRDRAGRVGGWLLVLGLFLAASATDAVAQSRVWATYGPADTGPSGPIGLPNGEGMVVHVWASSGASPSVAPIPACQSGASGDEICGLAVSFVSSGGFEIVDFSGNPNFDSGPSSLPFQTTLLSSTELRLNAFDLGAPTPANRWLGTLTLRGSGVGPASTVSVSGGLVGSNLEMRTLLNEVFIVPEPGFAGGLACASALLSALALARRRRMRS